MIAFLASYVEDRSFYEALELLKKISFLTKLDEKELSNLNDLYFDNNNLLERLLSVCLRVLLNYELDLSLFLSSYRKSVSFPLDYGDEQKIFLGFLGRLEEDQYKEILQESENHPLMKKVNESYTLWPQNKIALCAFTDNITCTNQQRNEMLENENVPMKVGESAIKLHRFVGSFFRESPMSIEELKMTKTEFDDLKLQSDLANLDLNRLFVKRTVELTPASTQCFKIDYELIAAKNFQSLYDYSLDFSKISDLFNLWNQVIKKYIDSEGKYTNLLETQIKKADKYSAARFFHSDASDLKRKMLECFVKKSFGYYKKYLPWITNQEIKELHAIQVRYYAIKSQKKHLLRIADVCSKVLQNQQDISTEQFKQSKESAMSLLKQVLIENALVKIPNEANFNVLNVSIPITEDEARDFLAYPRINNHVPNGEWFAPDFRWTCIYAFEAECDLAGKTVRADQIEDVACLLRYKDSGLS